jgi:hypothetical protein
LLPVENIGHRQFATQFAVLQFKCLQVKTSSSENRRRTSDFPDVEAPRMFEYLNNAMASAEIDATFDERLMFLIV